MFITDVLRKGTAPAVVAAAGLMLTALAPAAMAATSTPAAGARPGLHTSGTAVRLARQSAITVVTEASNGSVYFAVGTKVYAVNGTSSPAFVLTASGPVLALAVTSSDVFVQTGLTVTEYSKYAAYVRRWKLSSPVTPLTSAGLLVVGGTAWSWTDWATDESGFEYATVSKFSLSSGRVTVISKSDVFPADMAANAAGLYYQTFSPNGSAGYLMLTSPSGVTRHRVRIVFDSPLAISAGLVDLLSVHANGNFYLDSYRASTLAPVSSKRVSDNDINIAGTTAGLLVLSCGKHPSCSDATVGVLNPATGTESGVLSVPRAYTLLVGPAPAVLIDVASEAYLVRLAG